MPRGPIARFITVLREVRCGLAAGRLVLPLRGVQLALALVGKGLFRGGLVRAACLLFELDGFFPGAPRLFGLVPVALVGKGGWVSRGSTYVARPSPSLTAPPRALV